MIDYQPAVGDVFVSNYGRGPLRAKIIAIEDGKAKMLRWHGRTRFALA